MKTHNTTQRGVGLIEVLVAALVFAVGIAAVVKLQGTFFQSGSNANARALASGFAQGKIDELRATSFDNIAAGNDSQTTGAFTYTRAWTVTSFYYTTANPPVLTNCASAPAAPCDADGDGNSDEAQKSVTVTVSWNDPDTNNDTVALQYVINKYEDTSVSALGFSLGGSGESPQATYTPQPAPDVIAVKVGSVSVAPPSSSSSGGSSSSSGGSSSSSGGSSPTCTFFRETEKPDPDVEANSGGVADNSLVGFSTVTFKDCGNSQPIKKIQQEDFLTLNCSCELSGTTGTGFDQEHHGVTKIKTGTKSGQANGQHELCDTCCRDHHENTTGANVCDPNSNEGKKNCYDPFRPASDYAGGDHNHYASATATTAVGSGTYLEACRLKRVDGNWTVVQDWKLVGFNAFVRGDLTQSGNLTDYQTYVINSINNYVQSSTTPTAWTPPSASTPNNNTQMMARGIYVNYLTPTEIAALDFNVTGLVPSGVPFYEYHVTDLADWKTEKADGTVPHTSTASPCPLNQSANGTCVDSPTVSQVANANQNQQPTKGMYREDSGNNAPTTNMHIVATMKESNTGVTGTTALGTLDATVKTSTVVVPFSGGGGGGGGGGSAFSVSLAQSASLSCPAKWGTGNNAPTWVSQNDSSWSGIGLSCSPAGQISTCNYSTAPTVVTATASGTSGLTCTYTGSGNSFTCPASISETLDPPPGSQTLTGSKTVTIIMSKSGNSATCALSVQ